MGLHYVDDAVYSKKQDHKIVNQDTLAVSNIRTKFEAISQYGQYFWVSKSRLLKM